MKLTHAWFDQLEHLIQQKHMLKHPFYQAWSCGHLTRKQLQEYVKEYYHHVRAFPTYLSAVHSRCADPAIRRSLLNNLIDEEAGTPNHPDLWRSFMLALGVATEEIAAHQPANPTQKLVATFKECCASAPIAVGVAALYCYESQIPAVCQTKIDGLKRWYGFQDPEAYRYFSVHETADVEHSLEEKGILTSLVTEEQEPAVLQGADKVLQALGCFLSAFL